MAGFLVRAFFLVLFSHGFSLVHAERGEGFLTLSLPIIPGGGPILMTSTKQSLPMDPTSNTITLGVRASTYEILEGMNIQNFYPQQAEICKQ
jgi:hypothetical protein